LAFEYKRITYICKVKIRKHIAVLLAFLILIPNVGLAFNVHYCGSNIASVSIKTANSKTISCCAIEEEKSSCCKDKVIKIEKKSENTTVKNFDFNTNFDFLIQDFNPIIFGIKNNFKSCSPTSYTYNANAPPIFKRNCQLIFYA
jgi:hypothetical protein